MDRVDAALKGFLAPPAPPRLAARALARLGAASDNLASLVDRFSLEATERGITRLAYGRRGRDRAPAAARPMVERAREELAQYLAGDRTFFTVPVDLRVPAFQRKVLAAASRVPFGGVTSYAAVAARIGHPRAARAVGNALGANPVPLIVPCHRVVRGDGTWGHYAFGGALKTRLLDLERSVPALVGCASTRIVCRHGCAAERRIGPANRIVFASVADARAVGYRPCRVCRPERV